MTPADATHFANVRRGLMGVPDRSSLVSLDAIEREFRRMVRELEATTRHEVPKDERPAASMPKGVSSGPDLPSSPVATSPRDPRSTRRGGTIA